MIETIADIAAIDGPGPDISDADLADWIEQRQTVPLPDDDYPYHSPPRTSPTKHLADWSHIHVVDFSKAAAGAS